MTHSTPMIYRTLFLITATACFACLRAVGSAVSAEPAAMNDLPPFAPADIFQLEFASDPQISPDGAQIAYLRNAVDIMTDRVRSQMWLVGVDGREQRPLTDWKVDASSPCADPPTFRLTPVQRFCGGFRENGAVSEAFACANTVVL